MSMWPISLLLASAVLVALLSLYVPTTIHP